MMFSMPATSSVQGVFNHYLKRETIVLFVAGRLLVCISLTVGVSKIGLIQEVLDIVDEIEKRKNDPVPAMEASQEVSEELENTKTRWGLANI